MASIEKRQRANGPAYRVRVRLRGELQRTRTFKRKTDAELWAKKVESDLVTASTYRRRPIDVVRCASSLTNLAEQLPLRRHRVDERNIKRNLEWWKEHAGHVTLDKLSPQTIAGFRSQLLAHSVGTGDKAHPVSHATVNRYLAALSAVCKWAWKELHWLPGNPVLSVAKGPEKNTGIIRYLSDDERKALLDVCRKSVDPNIYCAVVLALATGARYSNLRMLTWDDVDFDTWRLRFTHTKNGEPRYVPVVGAAQRVLQQHYERDGTSKEWVFKGGRDGAPADLDAPWRVVRKAAGLIGDKHCRFHDLRHTTASYLTMNGATLAEVAEALGHRTLMMAKRYSHQSGEHVRGTLERMANRFLMDVDDQLHSTPAHRRTGTRR